MTTHRIMSPMHGDLAVTFDPQDKQAVAEAMERFKDLVGKQKMWAASPARDGKPARVVKAFEPNTDLLFMPQLIGG